MGAHGVAVVWGNCQAPAIADLVTGPLRAQGIEVVPVPVVYQVDPDGLARVHDLVRRSQVLVSQPVREDYSLAGCGTDHLAGLLPRSAQLVRFPVAFHLAAFPAMTHGHGGDDRRVDAPVTDYHDLRALVAAQRGLSVEDAVAWWPQSPPDAVRTVAARSRAELQRREAGLDVRVSDLLDAPDALWTMTHPSNAVLGMTARRVLAALEIPAAVEVPAREYLGERRAPIPDDVSDALGWPRTPKRSHWVVGGRPLPLRKILAEQLAFYRSRPDVVVRTLEREQDRVRLLGLDR